MPEFFAIQHNWMRDVAKVIPPTPQGPPAKAVFSDMPPKVLRDWIVEHYDIEGLTMDGERDIGEGITSVMKHLLGMTPKEQQEFFIKVDPHRNRY